MAGAWRTIVPCTRLRSPRGRTSEDYGAVNSSTPQNGALERGMTTDPEKARNQKTAIAPMLSVRKGASAIEFYKAAFGADELFRIDAESGAVVARLSVGGAEFWVADESPEHSNFSPESL